MNAETRWQRDPALQAVAMGEEIVMMGIDQGEYYALKGVAATVWERLAEPATLDELCARVAEEYEITAEGCRADVEAFVAQLHEKGMARPV